MAWTCSGRSNDELIDNMLLHKLIQSPAVAEAMRKVDRKNYAPRSGAAYEDSPQSIGFGATISAPHMHAHACEILYPLLPRAGEVGTILDVGSGSGYLTAVFHRLAPNARVVGIDHLPELAELGRRNMAKDGIDVDAPETIVDIVEGDGQQGLDQYAPFRVIHVGASAREMPEKLVDQLACPGRMFIPVGRGTQYVYQVDKDEMGVVTYKKLFGVNAPELIVQYVHLTSAQQQWPRRE